MRPWELAPSGCSQAFIKRLGPGWHKVHFPQNRVIPIVGYAYLPCFWLCGLPDWFGKETIHAQRCKLVTCRSTVSGIEALIVVDSSSARLPEPLASALSSPQHTTERGWCPLRRSTPLLSSFIGSSRQGECHALDGSRCMKVARTKCCANDLLLLLSAHDADLRHRLLRYVHMVE
jgi:hypothetical protein